MPEAALLMLIKAEVDSSTTLAELQAFFGKKRKKILFSGLNGFAHSLAKDAADEYARMWKGYYALTQYEEVAQRISKMLQDAARRGHIEIARNPEQSQQHNSHSMRPDPFEVKGELTKQFLSPREVAEVLDLSTDMVYRLLREGELPAVKLGAGKRQVWRIPLLEFRAYLETNRTGPERG